jgi:hypothetical protein
MGLAGRSHRRAGEVERKAATPRSGPGARGYGPLIEGSGGARLVESAANLARRAAAKALRIFPSAESDVSSISRPQPLQELENPGRTRLVGILSRKPQPLQIIGIL